VIVTIPFYDFAVFDVAVNKVDKLQFLSFIPFKRYMQHFAYLDFLSIHHVEPLPFLCGPNFPKVGGARAPRA